MTKSPTAPLVTTPAGGTPPLVSTIQGVLEWCGRVREGEPIALDVERASSFKYSAQAYLVQAKTAHAGILLFDPLAFHIPQTLRRTINSHPWVLHAARQDMPSLTMLEFTPHELFDTEVAARLLGFARVGLGSLTEDLLGVRLAKEHSAANWSTRPLPDTWLDYAALDVEYLLPLHQVLEQRLREAGKLEWALQEFAFESTFGPPPPRHDQWRSLAGIGQLRTPRHLAIARALWERRDRIARDADIAPFMVLRDKYLIAMAKAAMLGKGAFESASPRTLTSKDGWWKVARSAANLPESHLPPRIEPGSIPHHKSWARKHPEALAAYSCLREGLLARAEELHMPVENLVSPAHARELVWHVYGPHGSRERVTEQHAHDLLIAAGARAWQAELVAPIAVERMAS